MQVLSPLVDHYKTLVPFASGTELAAVVSSLSSVSCYPTAPKQLVNHKKYFLMVSEALMRSEWPDGGLGLDERWPDGE